MLPEKRRPTSPGQVLREEFLGPMEMSQEKLAKTMGVSYQTVHLIVNGKRSITADTAVLLARALETSPQFWMNLQTACDLWDAERRLARTS